MKKRKKILFGYNLLILTYYPIKQIKQKNLKDRMKKYITLISHDKRNYRYNQENEKEITIHNRQNKKQTRYPFFGSPNKILSLQKLPFSFPKKQN